MAELLEKDGELLYAIQFSKLNKRCEFRKIIESGADPTIADPISGLKPIHLAAKRGNLAAIRALLEDNRVAADTIDPRGKVAYEWAADFGHTKAEIFLVNHIIDNPDRYSAQAIREARHHLVVKDELAQEPIPV
jgi:ankyrin repeat protein